MSEYLSKKAVLEWFGLMHMEYSHNTAVSEFIESGIEIFESGAFDVDQTEVQRLRAALEQAKRNLLANAPKTALGHIEEALSATTVQAERINAPEGDGNDA